MNINRVITEINYDKIFNDFCFLSLKNKMEDKYVSIAETRKITKNKIVSGKNIPENRKLLLMIKKQSFNINEFYEKIDSKYQILIEKDIPDYILVQLFINMVPRIGSNENKVSNLYAISLINNNELITVQVIINPQMLIELPVKTFYKGISKDEVPYKQNGKFVTIAENSDGEVYSYRRETIEEIKENAEETENTTEEEKESKKNLVDYIGLSESSFEKSKFGILCDILQRVKRYSNYIKINFEEIAPEVIVEKQTDAIWKTAKEKSDIIETINKAGLTIINEYNLDITKLTNKLKQLQVNYVIGKVGTTRFNLICIPRDRYKNKSIDPHKIYTNTAAVHITAKSINKLNSKESSSILVILKELLIKNDLLFKKEITIIKENFFKNIEKELIFCIGEKEKDNINIYYLLMNKNKIEYMDEDEMYEMDPDFTDLCYERIEKTPDEVIVKYGENILSIKNADIFPVLPINETYDFFTNRFITKYTFEKKELAKRFSKYLKNKDFSSYIDDETETTIDDFLKEIKEEEKRLPSNAKSGVVKEIFRETGILCSNAIRSKEISEILYGGLKGINYFEKDNYKYYYLGVFIQDEFTSIKNIPRIRQIEIIKGEDFFLDILLPMYKVQFVKWGTMTIYPFPVKYLREAIFFMKTC